MSKITLDTIHTLMTEKFNQNEKEHKGITDHLKTLNNQTEKNTSFRKKNERLLEDLVDIRKLIWKWTGIIVAVNVFFGVVVPFVLFQIPRIKELFASM